VELLKQRNSNYHHICRLLLESVTAFGAATHSQGAASNLLGVPASAAGGTPTPPLFHCTDNVLFHRFEVAVQGPISLTTQIEIAIHCVAHHEVIGGEGMILEMDGLGGAESVRHFDCSVLSAYGHENERLLFAPADRPRRVSVASIRTIDDSAQWVKYRGFLAAINLYDDLLTHKGSPKRQRGDEYIAKQIEAVLQSDANDTASRQSADPPSFVATHFHSFCTKHSAIVLDIGFMAKYYPAVSRLFVAESGEWLRYDRIARVHRECSEITTSSFQAIEVSNEYLEAVLAMLPRLETSKLQLICVLNPSVQCEDDELISFGDRITAKGWKLGLNAGKLTVSRKLL